MAKFLQVGDRAINIEHIQVVRFFKVCERPRVSIEMVGGEEGRITFSGERGEAFMAWWNEHAEVYKAL